MKKMKDKREEGEWMMGKGQKLLDAVGEEVAEALGIEGGRGSGEFVLVVGDGLCKTSQFLLASVLLEIVNDAQVVDLLVTFSLERDVADRGGCGAFELDRGRRSCRSSDGRRRRRKRRRLGHIRLALAAFSGPFSLERLDHFACGFFQASKTVSVL